MFTIYAVSHGNLLIGMLCLQSTSRMLLNEMNKPKHFRDCRRQYLRYLLTLNLRQNSGTSQKSFNRNCPVHY